MNFESVETRHELVGRALGTILGVNHEQHMRESGAEVSAVGVMVARAFGSGDVHTFGAVQLDHRLAGHVAQTDGQHGLVFAVDARAVIEITGLVFFDHLRDSPIREDVACVDEAVQHFGGLFDEVGLVGVVLQLVVWFKIENHVEGLSILWNLFIETCEIEFISDIIFVYFTEEFVSS